jgi:DNA-binding XRE family transcriptional regulator
VAQACLQGAEASRVGQAWRTERPTGARGGTEPLSSDLDTGDLRVRFGRPLRSGRNLSQEDLALEAGLSRTFVGDVERGTRCPTICSVAALARVLGLEPYELLKVGRRPGPG